jgi:hypothetical protein
MGTARDVRPVIGTRRCSQRYKRLLNRQRADNDARQNAPRNDARQNARENNVRFDVNVAALLRGNDAEGRPPLDAGMVDFFFPAAPARRSARLAARTR